MLHSQLSALLVSALDGDRQPKVTYDCIPGAPRLLCNAQQHHFKAAVSMQQMTSAVAVLNAHPSLMLPSHVLQFLTVWIWIASSAGGKLVGLIGEAAKSNAPQSCKR